PYPDLCKFTDIQQAGELRCFDPQLGFQSAQKAAAVDGIARCFQCSRTGSQIAGRGKSDTPADRSGQFACFYPQVFQQNTSAHAEPDKGDIAIVFCAQSMPDHLMDILYVTMMIQSSFAIHFSTTGTAIPG